MPQKAIIKFLAPEKNFGVGPIKRVSRTVFIFFLICSRKVVEMISPKEHFCQPTSMQIDFHRANWTLFHFAPHKTRRNLFILQKKNWKPFQRYQDKNRCSKLWCGAQHRERMKSMKIIFFERMKMNKLTFLIGLWWRGVSGDSGEVLRFRKLRLIEHEKSITLSFSISKSVYQVECLFKPRGKFPGVCFRIAQQRVIYEHCELVNAL